MRLITVGFHTQFPLLCPSISLCILHLFYTFLIKTVIYTFSII